MATFKIQTQAPAGSGSGEVLPDGEYVLTIDDAKIEEDQFAELERDGSRPQKLVITWLLDEADVTLRQKRRGAKAGKKIWSRYGLFFYTKSNGEDTAFKALLTALDGYPNSEGIGFSVADFEAAPDDFEPYDLVGIKARCLVETYKKSKGANIGQSANKVSKVLPFEPDEDEAPLPVKPAARNVPQRATPQNTRPAEKDDLGFDDDIPF